MLHILGTLGVKLRMNSYDMSWVARWHVMWTWGKSLGDYDTVRDHDTWCHEALIKLWLFWISNEVTTFDVMSSLLLSFELFLVTLEVTTLDVVSSRNEPWALFWMHKRSRHLMSCALWTSLGLFLRCTGGHDTWCRELSKWALGSFFERIGGHDTWRRELYVWALGSFLNK